MDFTVGKERYALHSTTTAPLFRFCLKFVDFTQLNTVAYIVDVFSEHILRSTVIFFRVKWFIRSHARPDSGNSHLFLTLERYRSALQPELYNNQI